MSTSAERAGRWGTGRRDVGADEIRARRSTQLELWYDLRAKTYRGNSCNINSSSGASSSGGLHEWS